MNDFKRGTVGALLVFAFFATTEVGRYPIAIEGGWLGSWLYNDVTTRSGYISR